MQRYVGEADFSFHIIYLLGWVLLFVRQYRTRFNIVSVLNNVSCVTLKRILYRYFNKRNFNYKNLSFEFGVNSDTRILYIRDNNMLKS